MEPEFDHTSTNHTLADKFIVNDCMTRSYNNLMTRDNEVTALAFWDGIQVEEYIDDIVDTSSSGCVRRLRGGLELAKKKKNKKNKRKGNGGSGKSKCDSQCGNGYSVPPASPYRRCSRQLGADGWEADVFALEVSTCLLKAKVKVKGYLKAFDIGDDVSVSTREEEYTGDTEE